MTGTTFTKNFGAITVTVDTDGQITVRGPQAYIADINWASIRESTRLFTSYTSRYMALALAVQMNYAAWAGLRSIPIAS